VIVKTIFFEHKIKILMLT